MMLPSFASALLLLLAVGGAAPPLAAQENVPPPELAALPLDSLLGRMTRNDTNTERAALLEVLGRASPGEIAPYLRVDSDRLVQAAVLVLLRMGEPGAGVLLDELHASDDHRQPWILSVLGFIDLEEQVARPLAAALLRDADEELRIAGAKMLRRSVDQPGDTTAHADTEALVLAALADPSANVRTTAAQSLIRPRYVQPSEVRALIALLAHDPESTVRAMTALALGTLGHDGAPAVPALMAAMDDPDEEVRVRATVGLGGLGAAAVDAVPLLILASRGNDEALRQLAVSSLGRIGIDPPVQAGPVLRALEEALAHEDSTTRWQAATALAGLDARAVPLLIRALHDPYPASATAAAEALIAYGAALLPRLREAARAGSVPAAKAISYMEQGERLGIADACYAFRGGPWQLRMELGPDAVFITPPAQVRFLTDHVISGDDYAMAADAWFMAARADDPEWTEGRWRPLPGREALELEWNSGFSGVSLELLMEDGDAMRGTARMFWDHGSGRRTAEVTGERIPCPADDGGAE